MWDERGAPPLASGAPTAARLIKDEQISQVWFAGVHSNVGGGYPDDALAFIPFVWMMTEAEHCGLRFKSDRRHRRRADPDPFKNAISMRDKDGRMYDPRKGLGGYYRYGPRKLAELCNYRFARRTTRCSSRGRRFTTARSGASPAARTAMRRSGCRQIYDVVDRRPRDCDAGPIRA